LISTRIECASRARFGVDFRPGRTLKALTAHWIVDKEADE